MSSLIINLITFTVFNLLLSNPTVAQDISGLPSCATACLLTSLNAIGNQCSQTDFACLCKNAQFTSATQSCYVKACTLSDLPIAQAWGVKTCAAAGVTVATNAITSASNATNAALMGGNNKANSTSTTPNNTAPVNSTSPATNAPSAANSVFSREVAKFGVVGTIVASVLLL